MSSTGQCKIRLNPLLQLEYFKRNFNGRSKNLTFQQFRRNYTFRKQKALYIYCFVTGNKTILYNNTPEFLIKKKNVTFNDLKQKESNTPCYVYVAH